MDYGIGKTVYEENTVMTKEENHLMGKRVLWFEHVFFLFFGVMHLSRIWGLFDRQGYADAWLGLMYGKGFMYYGLMAVMALLCIVGIITFIANRGENHWWRWVYVFGGGYILFDLFAIAAGLKFWRDLLLLMFDISNHHWNVIWLLFVSIGAFCLSIGICLCRTLFRQRKSS